MDLKYIFWLVACITMAFRQEVGKSVWGMAIGSLSTHVFDTRTATGRELLVFQDSGVSHIFILIISNGEKIIGNVNVVVWREVKRENSSLPVAVRVSKTRVLKLPYIYECWPRCHAISGPGRHPGPAGRPAHRVSTNWRPKTEDRKMLKRFFPRQKHKID